MVEAIGVFAFVKFEPVEPTFLVIAGRANFLTMKGYEGLSKFESLGFGFLAWRTISAILPMS